MRSLPYDQLNDDMPLTPGEVPEEGSQTAVAQVQAMPSTVEEPPMLLGEPTTPSRSKSLEEPPKSARSDGVCEESPIGTEREWRAELAKLAVLVKSMKDQQADAQNNMLRLHKEQQKELKAAIKRVESSAPRGVGPASEKPAAPNGNAAETSAAQATKKVGPDDIGKLASGEVSSHPCAVQESADAGDKNAEQSVAMPSATDAVVPGEGPAAAQMTESRPVRWSRHVSDAMNPHTMHGMVSECCKKVRHFSELWRLQYGSRPAKGGRVTRLQWFASSFYFRAVVSAAILVSGICIGFQVDSQLKNVYKGQVDDGDWRGVEVVFALFFTFELIIRASAERWAFIFGENWAWNLFDSGLVTEAIIDLVLQNSAGPDFSFARILRLVRFTRVLRILRAMRSFQTLRVMVFSIVSSMMSLVWVFLLIFFMIYFFAVFFASGIAEWFTITTAGDLSVGSMPDGIEEKYSSILDIMMSLFMCISGGDDWSVMVTPLYEVNRFYVMLFVVYVFFMAFGVLNVVVGHFVDNAARASEKDRESVVKNELRQEKEYGLKMQSIFRDADKDGDGQLSWTEFEEYLSNGTAAAYFSTAGLDANIARTLFLLLDVDDTDKVGIEEFIGGCMRLKGSARSLDVNMLLYETEKMCYKLTEFMQETTDTLHKLASDPGATAAPRRRNSGHGDPDAGDTSPLHSVISDAHSEMSHASIRLNEFRRRPVRPCAALAGSELMRTSEHSGILNINVDNLDHAPPSRLIPS